MMPKSNLELDKLLKIAFNVLSKENFKDDLDNIKRSVSRSNIWKKIAESYFEGKDKKKDILNILEQYNVDRIFHFAGQSHVSKSWVYIDETFQSHTEITLNFLKPALII